MCHEMIDRYSIAEATPISSLLQQCVGMWFPSGMQGGLDKCLIDAWQHLREKQVFFWSTLEYRESID